MTDLEKAIYDYENSYIGIIELSEKYKIPKEKIRKALEDLGYFLGKGVSPKSVVNIKKAIDEYQKILTEGKEPNIYHLSQKYDVSHAAIKSNLQRLGIKVVRYPKKIQFNEHVFDVIDTEEKAYWLGFFAADGYITTKYNTVGISLASKDKEHVEKFAKFLGCPENVKFKKNSYTSAYLCEVGNAHLKNRLKSYGFDERKSYTLKFPNKSLFKDEELIVHFLRGHFDGDGCIAFHKKFRKKTKDFWCSKRISLVGTKNYISGFQEYFNLWNNKILKGSTENCYTIRTESRAQDVLELLYSNATIYLERKYNLYKNFAPHFAWAGEEKLLNIGESCDANTEIIEEVKESSTSYSVEIEPANAE